MPQDDVLAASAAAADDRIAWSPHGELEVLIFELGGETFALEAIMVQEILDLLPETFIPGAPELVAHVVNFRGKIVPVADLRLAFGMERAEATKDSRIVVIELPLDGETMLIGLRTDRVHEVATFQQARADEVPAVGIRWKRQHVRSLIRWHEDLVVLPDLGAIFLSAMRGHPSAPVH
ncbi:chemotaxis protein CheW [Sphingomonas metalli]|uniref:Chemotaxis protein CheW n=1 Tax=Sphingomonas metalli TaxID=1779358 RepID=A0A916WTG6_9SPHN|nr:chemotaxis protein CheW [Sphingomonas metalli]GGB28387.1 chemotaxis protein CheW [Sphingomonas metalli]